MRCGTGDWAAGERRAVIAGREDVRQPRTADQRADRQPAAERLGRRHQVGDDARVLVGPQGSRASQPGLDLVVDQSGAVLVAGRPRGVQQLVVEDMNAALALDRFEQHRGGALVDGGGDGPRGRRDRKETGHERSEGRLLGLLRRRRQRSVGASVKAALQRDDVAAGLGLARDLQRRLVGLGAGVGKVHPAAQRALGQPLGQRHRGLGVDEVADVNQLRRLLGDRAHDGGVAVAQRADRQAGLEVQVLVALVVVEQRALAAHELHGHPHVGGDQVLALERPQLLEAHREHLAFDSTSATGE